ncbi:MAG: hypothetical protein RL670_18 [Actinomycetota bacterium]
MTEEKATGKGRPTPSRKTAEKAHNRSIVSDRSKESRKADRSKIAEERRVARAGMMAGEERYLTARDRGPQKRLARDVVDSRFTVGELVMPALFVVILASASPDQNVQLLTLVGMWTLFLAMAIDAWLLGRKVKKVVSARYGADRLERGLVWYSAMRSMQMRSMRIPKAQVKRGTKVS